jgi:pre-mRNA-processing factor SLU7
LCSLALFFRLQNEIEAGEINNPDIDLKNEDKYGDDEVKMHSSAHVDSRQTVSVRNLRIREDTAKYLRNLDSNSAFYDPKTRSMRENPYEETGKVYDNHLIFKHTIIYKAEFLALK